MRDLDWYIYTFVPGYPPEVMHRGCLIIFMLKVVKSLKAFLTIFEPQLGGALFSYLYYDLGFSLEKSMTFVQDFNVSFKHLANSTYLIQQAALDLHSIGGLTDKIYIDSKMGGVFNSLINPPGRYCIWDNRFAYSLGNPATHFEGPLQVAKERLTNIINGIEFIRQSDPNFEAPPSPKREVISVNLPTAKTFLFHAGILTCSTLV